MREGDDADFWHPNADPGTVAPIGQGYLHVQSRLRVTTDGGHSILAVNDPEHTTRFGRVPRSDGTEEASVDDGRGAEWEPSHASPGGTSASAARTAGAAAPPCTQSSEKAKQAASPMEPVADGTQTSAQVTNTTSPSPPILERTSLSSNHPAEKALHPSAEEYQSAPPVFVLDGDLHKFRPLVAYLQQNLTSGPKGPILVKTTRKYFADKAPQAYGNTIDDVLNEALQLGLIQYAPSARLQIQLVPRAEYRLEEAVKLKPVRASTFFVC